MIESVQSPPGTTTTKWLASPAIGGEGENNFPWDQLVGRSGEEGMRWLADYHACCLDLSQQIQEALRLLRNRKLETGGGIFARVWTGICRIDDCRPDLRSVISRWYFAAHAYQLYLSWDLDGALREIDLAETAAETALRLQPLLLPLASDCVHFPILRARIARQRRQWDVMRRQVEILFRMADDRAPLCQLQGAPLYFSEVRGYLLALPFLNSEERRLLEGLVGRDALVHRMGHVARSLYALPGIMIPSV